MITIKHKGNFERTGNFIKRILKLDVKQHLVRCGEAGVKALSDATPIDTGKTASSWRYEIIKTSSGYSVIWTNDNVNKGVNIAIILQYGHGTRNGGYVKGIDYVNPALKPVFDELAETTWTEVRNS